MFFLMLINAILNLSHDIMQDLYFFYFFRLNGLENVKRKKFHQF